MIDKAAMVSPEQIQAFLFVFGFLAISNAGAIVSAAMSYFWRFKKMRLDIESAWREIRALKKWKEEIESKND